MKILPAIQKSVKKMVLNRSRSLAQSYNISDLNLPLHDTFVRENAQNSIQKLKEIKLKTAQMLLSTKPEAMVIPPEGVYTTHVIEKATGKPVQIFVEKDGYDMSYSFYRINENNEKVIIGQRFFNKDTERGLVTPGYMDCKDKQFAGIGIRGHQLAIEMMLKKGYKNVRIDSVMSAYPFHYGCGFRAIAGDKNAMFPVNHALDGMIKEWSYVLQISPEKIKKLLAFEIKNGQTFVNTDFTNENIAKCLIEKGKKLPFGFHINMELPQPALEEWIMFAKTQPILLEK